MHITIQEILGGSAATSLWLIYGAIWKHSPADFPKTVQAWWTWFRGTNQEIAAQHENAANPTTPAHPAQPSK